METALFAHQKKVQNASNSRKAYTCSFLRLIRAPTVHYQERVQLRSARFSKILCDMRKTAIRSERTGLLSVGVEL